ncbi:hypothetical protein CKAH01_04440 [Colletotrichum kahawae]|uniref:Uncharacterized protein n=1 Tax=Colletotrichum kahawae TaxID=34407 RepID=A0AAD9YN92_COLKA|nr:hypothetical protein CKAH01_04440 [Colletotrichum kahawae]
MKNLSNIFRKTYRSQVCDSFGRHNQEDYWRTFAAVTPCDTTNVFNENICSSLPASDSICDVDYTVVSAEDDTIDDADCSIAIEIDGTVYHGRLSDGGLYGSECGADCGFPPREFKSNYIFENVPMCD